MKHNLKNTAHVLKSIGQMLPNGDADADLTRTIREGLEPEVGTINDVVETLQRVLPGKQGVEPERTRD